MAKLKLVRVDSRLLHASIILYWTRYVNAHTIIIIDPIIAKDSFYTKIISLSAPSDIDVKVTDLDGIVSYWKDESHEDDRVILLVKKIEIIYDIKRLGIPISSIQLAQPASKSIQNIKAKICDYYSPKEKIIMQELLKQNVKIILQSRTDDDKVQINAHDLNSHF